MVELFRVWMLDLWMEFWLGWGESLQGNPLVLDGTSSLGVDGNKFVSGVDEMLYMCFWYAKWEAKSNYLQSTNLSLRILKGHTNIAYRQLHELECCTIAFTIEFLSVIYFKLPFSFFDPKYSGCTDLLEKLDFSRIFEETSKTRFYKLPAAR